jgi:hypothetical protein
MHTCCSEKREKLTFRSYAAHFGALNPLGIFAQLQRLEVLTSDKMSCTLTVKQSEKTVSVPISTAFFHLDASDGYLKLCIPQHPDRQQVCLSRNLPTGLLRHFGASVQNRGELGSIITATSLPVVDEILDQDGVIDIEGVCRPETTETETTIPTPSIELDTVAAVSAMRLAVQRPSLYQTQDYGNFDESSGPGHQSEYDADQETIDRVERPHLFKELISFVIEQAKLIEDLPIKGSHVLASRSSESVFDHGLAVDMDIHGRAWRKIGAVGELFVSVTPTSLTHASFITI